MLNSNVSTFVSRVASFSIFNSTAPKKVKIKDGRVMGENFLLSLRLFCLLRRLTFVAVLRCVHGMFTLFHLCTASMRCNRVYFHFNSIGVRSPRWVIFGELMFRYICRHFLCFLFSRWYFFSTCFVSRFVLPLSSRLYGCAWLCWTLVCTFVDPRSTFTFPLTPDIELLRRNEAWIFHLKHVSKIYSTDGENSGVLSFFFKRIDFSKVPERKKKRCRRFV